MTRKDVEKMRRQAPPAEKEYTDMKSRQVDILVARDRAVRAKDFDSLLDLLADRYQIELSL